MRNSMQKGFTLIELMIVIAIIGVLAAVAAPAYQDYIAKAQLSEAASLAEGVKNEVAAVFSADGTCPANTVAIGNIAKFDSIIGKYITEVATGGTATATGGCTVIPKFGTASNRKVQNVTFTYTLVVGTNNVTKWTCETDVDASIRPKTCGATGAPI